MFTVLVLTSVICDSIWSAGECVNKVRILQLQNATDKHYYVLLSFRFV